MKGKPSCGIPASKLLFAALLFAALLFAGCEQPPGGGGLQNDSDATLSALQVSAGNLQPAFSPEITEYTVVVANGVEEITVTARAASAAAAIYNSAQSAATLSAGNITPLTVRVSAANGGTKTYTLNVRRLEGGVIAIGTAEEFAKIGVDPGYPLAGAYELGASLTLDNWNPVGTDADHVFSGTFSGNNYVLNLRSFDSAAVSNNRDIGIFGYVKGGADAKAEITGLKIISTVYQRAIRGQCVGLLAGFAENALIESVELSGTFGYRSPQTLYLGGIVGVLSNGAELTSCTGAMGLEIEAGNGMVTGLTPSGNPYNYIGGLAGMFRNGAAITRCHNTGFVSTAACSSSAQIFAGGIAGGGWYSMNTAYHGYIADCSYSGTITNDCTGGGAWAFTGGITACIAGDGNGSFENTTRVYRCRASGDIQGIGAGWRYTGGIVGYVYFGAQVAECSFNGNIIAPESNSGYSSEYLGGIAGYLSKQDGGHNSVIRDCWSAGTITGNGNAGGIVGQQQIYTYLWNCYSRSAITVNAPAGAAGNACQEGAGGIAGFNGSEETGGAKRQSMALSSCVALNPSITAPNGFEKIGRVTGKALGTSLSNEYGEYNPPSSGAHENDYAWSGMTVPATAYDRQFNGADCDAKPNQAFYQSLGWDFANVWKMSGDWPVLIWE
jgi:hypothetical protein